MEKKGDTRYQQEQYHCTYLQLLAMLALGSGAYRKQESSVEADPDKTLVATFPCESTSYTMSFYNENDTSRRDVFKSKSSRRFAKWKAPLQPVTLHIEGAAKNCKLISTISEALQNKRPTFTILLHDICQLAARLFRLKGYSEIRVNCDEDLLRKIFIRFKEEELVVTKFLAWFSTVCLTECGKFSLMDPIVYNDFNGPIFQHKQSFDTNAVPCIQYNDRSFLIRCLRGVETEEINLADKLLPGLHHIKDDWWTTPDLKTLSKLLKALNNPTSSEKLFASDRPSEESSAARDESVSKRLILLPCATMLEFFDVIRGMKKKDESEKEEEQALVDGMCRQIFEAIRNEVDCRQKVSPESRHHLSKRLAILTILFLETGDRQNKGSDAGSYFSKAFNLLEQTCSKTCEVALTDSTRPQVLLPARQARRIPPDSPDLPTYAASAESTQSPSLSKQQLRKMALQATSKEYDEANKSKRNTATCWEVEVPRKLFLRVPSCYYRNRVLVVLLYLVFCDAASSFYQLFKEKNIGCIEIPCLLEFYHLKKRNESIEVPTLVSEYISLLKILCSKRFDSLGEVKEYKAESIGFDFSIIEKPDGKATARHYVSVKSYTDNNRTIFYVSRDDASHDVDGTKLKKLAKMCVETSTKLYWTGLDVLDWTSILFNCSGENCTLGAVQQWEVSKLNCTTSEAANCSGCWKKKERLLKHLKKEFDPQNNDSQDKDSHGNGPQDKNPQDTDPQDKDSHGKKPQDKDPQDRDPQDRDPQDRDPQDTNSEDSDSCGKFKQGFFIPSDVFFSMRFALGSFQLSSRTERSFHIRELLIGFLRDSDKERRASYAITNAKAFVAS